MKSVWVWLSGVVLVSGCATMDAVRPKNDTRSYAYSLPVSFAAAKAAAVQVGLQLVEEAPDKSFFTAKRGVTAFSMGEMVGVYLTPTSSRDTDVTVRNVRRLSTNILAADFTSRIHEAMPPHLAMFAKPGALPASDLVAAATRPAAPDSAPPAEAIITINRLGNFHALVIGNDDYQALPKLRTAVSDARALATTLSRQYGFEVELLLDANRADILRALRKCRELPAGDNLLIYYAGHGWLDKEADEGYWLAVDAEQEDSANWIPNSTITTEVRALQTKHVMIIADSCYSGKLTRGVKLPQRTPGYYQRMAVRKARVVLSSGGLEPVADGGGKTGHSVFASALLDALRSNTSILDGVGLFGRIRESVGWNADQVPEYGVMHKAGHDGGDFFFKSVRVRAPAPKAAETHRDK